MMATRIRAPYGARRGKKVLCPPLWLETIHKGMMERSDLPRDVPFWCGAFISSNEKGNEPFFCENQQFFKEQYIPSCSPSGFTPGRTITGYDRPKAILILLHQKSPKEDMSYLEKIQSLGRQANPFFCLTGIDIVNAGPGTAVLMMPVRPDMHNGVGWLQGGMLVALADEAMALALYPLLEKHEGIATIAESTSFIKGVQKGTILAEARVIKKGRRVAFMEADVWVDDGKKTLLSRTSASFAITAAK